jgi:hypothetical protein
MTHRLLVFLGFSLLLWAMLAMPACAYWGSEQLLPSGAAFALVLIPGVATFVWVSWAFEKTPDMRLLAALGASGVRMLVALGGGVSLMLAFPQFFDVPFLIWLIVLYLGVLALELTLLLRSAPAGGVQQLQPVAPSALRE